MLLELRFSFFFFPFLIPLLFFFFLLILQRCFEFLSVRTEHAHDTNYHCAETEESLMMKQQGLESLYVFVCVCVQTFMLVRQHGYSIIKM